jgi:hypothetical protein
MNKCDDPVRWFQADFILVDIPGSYYISRLKGKEIPKGRKENSGPGS